MPRYVLEPDDLGRVERPIPAEPVVPTTGDADLDAFLRDDPQAFDPYEAAGRMDTTHDLPDLTYALTPVPAERRWLHLTITGVMLVGGLGLAGEGEGPDPWSPMVSQHRAELGPAIVAPSQASLATSVVAALDKLGTSVVSVRVIEADQGTRLIATFANVERIDSDVTAFGLVVGQHAASLSGIQTIFAVRTPAGEAGLPIDTHAALAMYTGSLTPRAFLNQAGGEL